MFILGFGVEGVSRIGPHFPLRPLAVVELIGDVVVGSFGGLLAEAVDNCHLFGDEFFGLGVAGGSSEGEVRCGGFFALSHFSEGRVYFSVAELDEVLVGVHFLFFLLLPLHLGHCVTNY